MSALSETRGFTLSYERQIMPLGKNLTLGAKGFLGYGFQYTPSDQWKFATYDTSRYSGGDRWYYDFGDFKEYSLGAEANILWGKRKHFGELGVGLSLDIFDLGLNFYADRKALGGKPYSSELAKYTPSKLASHYYGRVGYRYVSGIGITLGAGLSFQGLQGPFTYFYAQKFSAHPYITLGYSF